MGSVPVVLTEEREGEYNGRAGAYYGIWLMAVAAFDVLIGEGAPQYRRRVTLMYSYTVIQWLFFFYFYCFAGWCFESAYVSIKSRELTNRGFLRGPFLPIYGSGAIMMLVVSMPFQDNIVLTYIAGCIGATALEYVTGVAMEALFKVRYWDYSKNKFNFQGHICLGSSLAWGVLTIFMTELIHVPVEKLVLSIPAQILTVATYVLTVVIFADFALSFKAAMDLRNVLVKMEQAKAELVHIRKRLDVIIALADQDWEERKAAFAESRAEAREAQEEARNVRLEELKAGIESGLKQLKQLVQSKHSAYPDSVRDEVMDLKTKYAVNLELRKRLGGLKDFFQRGLIRSNPGMTSERFKEALEELKQRAGRRKGE
jgi:uncharacterized membrane protein